MFPCPNGSAYEPRYFFGRGNEAGKRRENGGSDVYYDFSLPKKGYLITGNDGDDAGANYR